MADPTPTPAATTAPLPEAEDRQWASFAHFGNIIGIVPALVIWLVFKDRGTRTSIEGKEALNWIINITGVVIVLWVVFVIFELIAIPLPLVAILADLVGLLILAVYVFNVIFAIMAGSRVYKGGNYRYPINIRWIK